MPFLRKKGLFESTRVQFLPVACLLPNPSQPRKQFSPEDLKELAASIAEHGILQPLSVRRTREGYELISGERRLRAASLAGLQEVPCILVSANDTQSSVLSIVENIQRRDLNFWEEAQALQALMQATGSSQEAVAKQVGKSQPAIANKLRLLKLSQETLCILRDAGLSERHARALLSLQTPLQESAARYIAEQGLTVLQTEAYVQSLQKPPDLDPEPCQHRKTRYVMKDVRLFLNTIHRGVTLMQTAGVAANCERTDTEKEILLTIRIPR